MNAVLGTAARVPPDSRGGGMSTAALGRVNALFVLLFALPALLQLAERFKIISPTLSGRGAIFGTFCLALVMQVRGGRGIEQLSRAAMPLSLLFLVATVVTQVVHLDDTILMRESVGCILIFVICRCLDSVDEMIRAGTKMLVLLCGIYGLLLLAGPRWLWNDGRFSGFGHSNNTGIGLVALIACALADVSLSRRFKASLVSIASVFVFMTVSRTTLACWAAVVACFGLQELRHLPRRRVLTVAGLGAVAPVGFGIDKIWEFISRGQNLSEMATFTGRSRIWLTALKMIGADPWLGKGSDSRLIKVWLRLYKTYFVPGSAHNMFLEAALARGIPYCILLSVLMLYMAAVYVRRLVKLPVAPRYHAFFCALTSCLLIESLTESASLAFGRVYSVLFWYAIFTSWVTDRHFIAVTTGTSVAPKAAVPLHEEPAARRRLIA